jgi:hypothetical protein
MRSLAEWVSHPFCSNAGNEKELSMPPLPISSCRELLGKEQHYISGNSRAARRDVFIQKV